MANGFKTGSREAPRSNKRQAIGKRVEEFLEYDELVAKYKAIIMGN